MKMICCARKVSVTGLIKIQWLHLRDRCQLFIFCAVSSLQSSSWGNCGFWSVPSLPECPNLLVSMCLANWWFCVLAPSFTKWLLEDLNAFSHHSISTGNAVQRTWSTQQTRRIMSDWKSAYLEKYCLWNHEDTSHISL